MRTYQLGQDEDNKKDFVQAFTSRLCLIDGDMEKHSDLDGNESQQEEEEKGTEILSSGASVSACVTKCEIKDARSNATISCSSRLLTTVVQ